MKRYGIGTFKKAGQVLKDAQKDVRRPKDESNQKNQKQQGGGQR